jgi:hypothetical protein
MFSANFHHLFSNWHPMRWITLILGLILGYNWFFHHAPISGVLSVFFLFQAVTNSGCLAGRCAPVSNQAPGVGDDHTIEYEEVKK